MGANFVYHSRPRKMLGDVLYPLNQLRALHPEVYAQQIAKYGDHPDRLAIPGFRIPLLDCLWNDVVQCAPIHPHLLFDALAMRGLQVKSGLEFFQIPVTTVANLPAVLYTPAPGPLHAPLETEVAWFDAAAYEELHAVPSDTLAWYDRLAREGRVYGHFVGVPHVMVHGPIDISDAHTITWG